MAKNKLITPREAAEQIPDGARIMCGGFMGCGSPHAIIDALSKSGKGNFTLISNDGSRASEPPERDDYFGVAKLIHNGQVKKLITTHVGLNPEVGMRFNNGSLELELIPMGTFAEIIRAGGSGLGGVITPTGVGTVVEDDPHVHDSIVIDGKKYLISKPLRADVALINGYKIDTLGNIWYRGTTSNFNTVMATAADLVIAEADTLVEPGDIPPEDVRTSHVFVDYIVKGGDIYE